MMKLPFIIKDGLPRCYRKRWQEQFVKSERDFEGLWRRTQEKANRIESGWKKKMDQRRRMLHYFDKYNFVATKNDYSFVLEAPYLFLNIASPEEEVEDYLAQIGYQCRKYNWLPVKEKDTFRCFEKGDLKLKVFLFSAHPQDIIAKRSFSSGYKVLEVIFESLRTVILKEHRVRPWAVLKTGLRKKDKRGRPKLVNSLREIKKFFPMQVELGCGPSIEAGVPPLHYLHQIYYVINPKTGKFIFGCQKDKLLIDLISNPEEFYRRASVPYITALTCKLTPFYKLLKQLHEQGITVGSVITNNFDGLCQRVGLNELYVRRYDEVHVVPKIKFHPAAKSLLVVGSHADRRKIQASARGQGLRVIYVDPEGYWEQGKFRPYQLESPQDEDILLRMNADEFTSKWQEQFGLKS